MTVSDGVNTHIDIMKSMIIVTNSTGTYVGWTGTKNGLRFIGGICVGVA
nr:MAG TPA: FAM176 family [Bacteriophage sp.]